MIRQSFKKFFLSDSANALIFRSHYVLCPDQASMLPTRFILANLSSQFCEIKSKVRGLPIYYFLTLSYALAFPGAERMIRGEIVMIEIKHTLGRRIQNRS